MYRSVPEMIEGWTKNLALLFPRPLLLATMQKLQFLLFFGLPILALWMPLLVSPGSVGRSFWSGCGPPGDFNRVARSHFPAADIAISIFGVPLFAWLLFRSFLRHRVNKSVDWKGRTYKTGR